MRCGLHRIDKGFPAALSCQPPKVVRSDDDDFFPAVDGHVLRPFLLRAADDLTEPGLRVLQLPSPRSRPSRR
jgi:hypothetical protein